MATSGTSGQTSIEVAQIIDHTVRRCGVPTSAITTEVVQMVKDNLFMLLSTLSNRGINMWRIDRQLIGLYPGQSEYTLDDGVLDVLEALYRMPQRLGGTITSSAGGTTSYVDDGDVDTALTQVSTGGNIQWAFDDTTYVNMVGILPNASSTLSLVFESSDDGVTWRTVKTVGSTSYVDRTWVWYAINNTIPGTYFRVRESSTGTINFREVYLSQTWTDIPMWRMNRNDYSALPNKQSINQQPLQYWFDRQIPGQKMVMWPVPNSTFYLVSLFVHMQIEDIGAISNTLDIPQRWYDAVVANLAFNCILELPGADLNRYNMLKEQAAMTMATAESEERDRGPSNFVVNIAPYTS